ncbi:MAG TPA: hypothetical protein VMU46_05515 [Burkholderiales bacterium]|nr:hypothetical protein [Burkholderiales bacterium]
MKDILKRLQVDRWIAEGAPAFWVIVILLLLAGAAAGMLAALFVFLEWRIPALVASWAIGALVVCFVGCGIWFVVDALTAKERPVRWRP